tara:strand:- start:153 stop:725 length:573 start_codon:yes stop_codon:yes gene_type:complete
MIGSHSKKFIFFHLYKVAGCSIVQALAPDAEFKTANPHTRPQEVLEDPDAAKLFKDYYTFSFVRNPWDWQVSLYEYMRGTPDHPEHELCMSKNFDEYIEWRVTESPRTQYQFLSDKGDNESPLSLDFIGRLESIDSDFSDLRLRLGIVAPLPHLNKSKRDKNYQQYYSSHSRKLVEDTFKIDIDAFNYEF